MKRIFLIGIFIFAMLWIVSVKAQNMDLNQCIEYALKNNLSHTGQLLQSDINKEAYYQSKRDFLPSVVAGSSANKRYGRSIDPTTNAFVNQDFFSMNFYMDSQIDIFRGFTRVNRMKFQKLRYLISQEDIKQNEMETAFGVMNAYYDVLYFSNLYNIVKEQLKLSELNRDKTKKLIDLGLKAESDLLEMNAQQASETHNLIKAENQREQALLKLKKWMNYPIEEALSIADEAVETVSTLPPDAHDVYEVALQHMPSVQRANLEVEASRKNVAMIRGELAPRLTLGAGLNTNYADSRKELNDPTNPGNQAMHTISFHDQWHQNMAKSIYVSLQIPIFNRWNTQSYIKRAKLERCLAINKQQEEQQNLYQLINEDIQQINALHKEVQQLQAKKEALREAYTIAEKKLEQGLINVIEFYTSKNQLAQAETDLMRIQLQLKVKERTLRFYMGEKFN